MLVDFWYEFADLPTDRKLMDKKPGSNHSKHS
jgi:hypothetical protein